MTSAEQLELLESAVALRLEGRKVPESVRRTLAAVEERMLTLIGPLVRKRVAARLLGASVQALDRWVAKGVLPVRPIAEGATRMALPTEVLIDVAYELAILRQTDKHATIGEAIMGARQRRLRTIEFQSAHNLISFSHQIAQVARRRRTAP